MSNAFNFTAAPYAADSKNQPAIAPGKIRDRSDNDGHSGVPEGCPGVYGRVLVAGYSTSAALSGSHAAGDRHYTKVDTVSLPDIDGEYLMTPGGVTYADAGWNLPRDTDGNPIYAGVGMWTEHNKPHPCQGRLEQPIGLGDKYFQNEQHGMIGMAIEGNIYMYTETDIERGDDLFYRVQILPADIADGIKLIGAIRNDDDGGTAIPFNHGRAIEPGPAGGLFVCSLNLSK